PARVRVMVLGGRRGPSPTCLGGPRRADAPTLAKHPPSLFRRLVAAGLALATLPARPLAELPAALPTALATELPPEFAAELAVALPRGLLVAGLRPARGRRRLRGAGVAGGGAGGAGP